MEIQKLNKKFQELWKNIENEKNYQKREKLEITLSVLKSAGYPYSINCRGDACVGDEVLFARAEFGGSWRSPVFLGWELFEGKIIKDSYGKEKQQHTFTLLLKNGEKTRIKGRNLYRLICFRKKWKDEEKRNETLKEKHVRGSQARFERQERRELEQSSYFGYQF